MHIYIFLYKGKDCKSKLEYQVLYCAVTKERFTVIYHANDIKHKNLAIDDQ